MYKAGETVRVKDKAFIEEDPNIFWAEEMDKYCGKEMTIRLAKSDFRAHTSYELEEAYAGKGINDNGYWMFIDKWLEPVNDIKFEVTENDLKGVFECLV